MTAPVEVIDVDSVPAIAEPAEVALASPVPAEYQARVVMSAEDAAAQARALEEMTRAVLKQDVHYGVIPGTHKPSLYKPGAEWLLKVYGFGHHFTKEDVQRDGDRGYGVEYRCHVTKLLPDGRVIEVATCDGYAGRDESKWASAPWNTILKMAQKRALVGACLQATGTSGMFTQDVEDYDHEPAGPPPIPDPDDAWRDVLGNRAGWYDNRENKRSLKAPDFKAKPGNALWGDKGEYKGKPDGMALWLSDAPEGFVEALYETDPTKALELLDAIGVPVPTGRGPSTEAAMENLSTRDVTARLKAAGLALDGTNEERLARLRAASGAGGADDREASGGDGADPGGSSVAAGAGSTDAPVSPPVPASEAEARAEAEALAASECSRCFSKRTTRVLVGGNVVCKNSEDCDRRAAELSEPM